jgi:hypothetical protein
MRSQKLVTGRRRMCVGLFMLSVQRLGIAEPLDSGQFGTSFNLLPADFDANSLEVLPPPLDDLTEARLLLTLQRNRTREQISQIKAQAVNPMPLFWKCAGIDESRNPDKARRILMAVADTEAVVVSSKRRFNRLRPSVVLPDIRPVVPVPPYAAYPSGHATQATVIAHLMAELAPKSARQLHALAAQVGRNREVAGLHYASDTDTGFSLGARLSKIFLSL